METEQKRFRKRPEGMIENSKNGACGQSDTDIRSQVLFSEASNQICRKFVR
jgi:hypothetical protein